MVDVLCIGGIFIDHLFVVKHIPQTGDDVVANRYAKSVGGCAANVAIGTALLGLSSAVLSVTGDDDESFDCVRRFRQAGVSTDYLLQIEGEQVAVCVSLFDEAIRQPTYVCHTGVNERLGPEHVPTDWGKQVGWLYVSAYDLLLPTNRAAVRKAVQVCKRQGGQVLFDLCPLVISDGADMELEKLLAVADVITGTEEECNAVLALHGKSPWAGIDGWAEQLLAQGVQAVHVKRGKDGSRVYTQTGRLEHPAFQRPILDTTGAGDAYVSALLFTLVRGWRLEKALPLCHLFASLACSELGATAGLLTMDELKQGGYVEV